MVGAKPHSSVPEPANCGVQGGPSVQEWTEKFTKQTKGKEHGAFAAKNIRQSPCWFCSAGVCKFHQIHDLPYNGVKQHTDSRYDVPM